MGASSVTQRETHTTGNLWFALPRIAPPPGGVDRLAFLMMEHRGLIELRGEHGQPFLQADGTIDGRPLFGAGVTDALHAEWIPEFSTETGEHGARLVWLTPHDERGMLGRLAVHNRGQRTLSGTLTFTLRWAQTHVTTYDAEPFAGHVRLMPNGWGGGIGLSWATARTEFGLGVGCSGDGTMHLVVRAAESDDVLWEGPPDEGPPRHFPAGARIELTCRREYEIAAGATETFELYLSAAPDTKAACLDARYFREQGYRKLFERTVASLARLNAPIHATETADPALLELLRRNRLFCYFYSLGRTLDTEEICPVTSRSSDYYVSAAYWDRDQLLWSFPTILDMDRAMAAAMLEVAFGRQGANIGIHSRLITGAMCEPGFELDELCAPVLALDRFLTATGDWGILERIDFDRGLRRIEGILAERRHPDVALFSTDYLPTDDQAQLPYCIYNNVLVWRLAHAVARIERYRENASAAQRWGELAEEVAVAIRRHGVVTHEGRELFAWSIDLDGRYRLYDEPPGSLSLLAWLGFTGEDDAAFRATCDWLYSTSNPHYFPEADEIGCLHEPHPWILAVGNSLRLPGRRAAALALLRRSAMDNGLACEAIDEQTGRVVSGAHFATCAGFLADALVEALYGRSAGQSAVAMKSMPADAVLRPIGGAQADSRIAKR